MIKFEVSTLGFPLTNMYTPDAAITFEYGADAKAGIAEYVADQKRILEMFKPNLPLGEDGKRVKRILNVMLKFD